MQARAAFRSGVGVTCLFAAAGANATPPVGPAPQSPEVMLYISHPIGGGSGGFKLPSLSLRIGQARMGVNSGNPSAGDPLQHRELFRLEIAKPLAARALDVHLGLGNRVTYDLKSGTFGLHRPAAKPPLPK